MTIEEARKVLDGERLAITFEYRVSTEKQQKMLNQKFEALNVAIGAIDKQRPIKPVCCDNNSACPQWGKCLACGGRILNEEKYCLNCGQALDWSDFGD